LLLILVDTHKHLGATFSSDCKWNKHVDTLIEKTSKQKFKLKLKLKKNISTYVNRQNIYVLFNIRNRQNISVQFNLRNRQNISVLFNLRNRENIAVPFNLRNRQNISVPFNRLSLYQQSYFPSTISLWYSLNLNVRQIGSIHAFSRKVSPVY